VRNKYKRAEEWLGEVQKGRNLEEEVIMRNLNGSPVTLALVMVILAVITCCTAVSNTGPLQAVDLPLHTDITITFWGGAREVQGSCYQLTVDGESVLIDCGSFMNTEGLPETAVSTHSDWELYFDPSAIAAIVVTHAHDDHIGRIPFLVDRGFSGTLYMTKPTADILKVKVGNNERFNDISLDTYERVVSSIQEVSYEELVQVTDSIAARFVDAGHIPGSASVILDIESAGASHTLAFSGDIGSGSHPFLNPPVYESLTTSGAELLVIESTYGNTVREGSQRALEVFSAAMADAMEKGHLVIIPAFALDRTQRILAALGEVMKTLELPDGKAIEVGGYSSCQFTDLYLQFQSKESVYAEYFAPAFWEEPSLQSFWEYTRGEAYDELEPHILDNLFDYREAYAVIVTPSGFGTSSLSKYLICEYVDDPEVTFVIVGWAPADSPVGQLKSVACGGTQYVNVCSQRKKVRATVVDVPGLFSGHADQTGLVDYAKAFRELEKIVITHGELDSMEALREKLLSEIDVEIIIPAFGQSLAPYDSSSHPIDVIPNGEHECPKNAIAAAELEKGNVVICGVLANAPGRTAGDEIPNECIAITNTTERYVDLRGLEIWDIDENASWEIPVSVNDAILGPGEVWCVYGRTYNPEKNCQTGICLNNKGKPLALRYDMNQLDRWKYPGGSKEGTFLIRSGYSCSCD